MRGPRTLIAIQGAVAALALSGVGDDGLGYSNADRESDEQRRRAKAERETWEEPEGESRQVRRARERKEAKR